MTTTEQEREELIDHLCKYGIALDWQRFNKASKGQLRDYVSPIADFILQRDARREADLVKKARHYTADGLAADGLDPWAVPVSALRQSPKPGEKQ